MAVILPKRPAADKEFYDVTSGAALHGSAFRRAGCGRVSRLSRSRKRILDFMLQESEEQGLNVFGICRTKNHMIDTRLRGRKDLL